MKTNELRPAKGAIKKRTRRGRGNASGLGGEGGRGHKGAKARSGYSRRAGFEGGQTPLYRRLPKNRGFNNPFKKHFAAVNLETLEQMFAENDTVDVKKCYDLGLAGKGQNIKLLGSGELKKKLVIRLHKASQTALEKLKASGSQFEVVA